MAQAHKGPRTQVKMFVPGVVLELIQHDQLEHRVEQRSQFIADLLCLIYSMKNLVRELDPDVVQLELPIPVFHRPSDILPTAERSGDGDRHPSQVKVRVPDEVMTRIKQDAARVKVSSWSQFIADLLCHVYGRPDLACELHRREEQLELPISAARHEPAA